MEMQWARKQRKGRSQRVPLPIVCLHSHDEDYYDDDSRLRHPCSEDYVALAGHNNSSVPAPPCISHICTLRGKKFPSTCQLRKLHTRALHLHGRRTVPWIKGGCPYNLRHLSVPDHSKLMQDPKELNHLLSKLGDFDVESEASRAIYATIAVNEVNKLKDWNPELSKGTYDLVECGPIALGHSSDGLILHFNFKARNINEPDAPMESFFTELVKTNRNFVCHVSFHHLGPSSLLPDKANTFGCLYCSSHNIHHPYFKLVSRIHNGRELLYTTLESQIQQINKFIQKSDEEGFIPLFSHPGMKYFGRFFSEAPAALAKVALNLFNSGTKGSNFKLVKLWPSGKMFTSLGLVVHMNFEAKNKDDPDAPLKTFFAEVIRSSRYILASFCVCLGPSNFVPPAEPKKHGCTICDGVSVHHPPGPGYINGREHFKF